MHHSRDIASYLSKVICRDMTCYPKFQNGSRDPDYAPFGGNLSCFDWHLPGSIHFYHASYASAVLGVVILSVYPSVCHTRALWLIQRTDRRYFYTTWKGNHSSFLMPKISAKFQRGHPQRGRQREVRYVKTAIFDQYPWNGWSSEALST